jgi:hypothetical protein
MCAILMARVGCIARFSPASYDVRFWRILLQKSVVRDQLQFAGPLARRATHDVRTSSIYAKPTTDLVFASHKLALAEVA